MKAYGGAEAQQKSSLIVELGGGQLYNPAALPPGKLVYSSYNLTHCGRVTQICVFTLQLCRTGDADLRF